MIHVWICAPFKVAKQGSVACYSGEGFLGLNRFQREL